MCTLVKRRKALVNEPRDFERKHYIIYAPKCKFLLPRQKALFLQAFILIMAKDENYFNNTLDRCVINNCQNYLTKNCISILQSILSCIPRMSYRMYPKFCFCKRW